jgi:DNA-binding MurR/RpiR family transcriptional regulator
MARTTTSMFELDLVETLRDRYPGLTAGQRRIAEFLVQHQDEAQFLTAAQLAARAGVSESAVVRFAQVLGFSGYPQLRRAICHDFRARATNNAMLLSGRTALADETNPIWEIARRDATLIEETALGLNPAMLDRWADRMLAAGQVFVTGHRASYALAEYLATTLRQGVGVGTPLSFGTGMAFDTIGSARPGDLVIAISISPYAQQTIDILCAAKQQGLTRLVITDHPLGAPARLADEALLFETEIHPFTSSYVGVMTIVHMLLALISRRAMDRAEPFIARVDALNEAYRIRYQPLSGTGSPCDGKNEFPLGTVSGNGRTSG